MALGHQGNHSKLKTKSKTTNFIMAQRKGYSDKTNLDLYKFDKVITSKNIKIFTGEQWNSCLIITKSVNKSLAVVSQWLWYITSCSASQN